MDVSKWFLYEDSNKLEHQVMCFIASTVEGYLNGCRDVGYPPMKREEWIDYVWNTIEFEKNYGADELRHLYFYGKPKIIDLINVYLDNYDDVKEYIL